MWISKPAISFLVNLRKTHDELPKQNHHERQHRYFHRNTGSRAQPTSVDYPIRHHLIPVCLCFCFVYPARLIPVIMRDYAELNRRGCYDAYSSGRIGISTPNLSPKHDRREQTHWRLFTSETCIYFQLNLLGWIQQMPRY